MGPRAGQKVFSLQTVPARADEPRRGVAQYAGFSLLAGIGVEAEQREKLERLTRYVSRPPVAIDRLALTAQGQVRYRLKYARITPARAGAATAAGVAVLIRMVIDGLVVCSAGGGRCCAQHDRRHRRRVCVEIPL